MNRNYRNLRALPLLLGAAVLGSVNGDAARAQDGRSEARNAERRNCVSLPQIDRTRVVDENTMLFYMKGGEVLRNQLPVDCPTLRTEKTFMYRTAVSQLCRADTITVLADVGFGFMPGATCLLGDFETIGVEERETLEQRADR